MKIRDFETEVNFSQDEEVLRAALRNEIMGRELYLQYARTLKNELARRVFTHLAKEEEVHIEDIREFVSSLHLKKHPDLGKLITGGAAEETKEFFGRLSEDLANVVQPGDDDLKSMEVAMKVEKMGYEYYKKGAETTKDPGMKKFLEWLMEQEQLHYMLIRNASEFASSPESWYAGEEHWLLEG
jgi:rubrerythrin